MAKRTTASKSVTMVTPSSVCVNGPSARSSATSAMALDGDRAMATTEESSDAAASRSPAARPMEAEGPMKTYEQQNTNASADAQLATARWPITLPLCRTAEGSSSAPAAMEMTPSAAVCSGASTASAGGVSHPTARAAAPARRCTVMSGSPVAPLTRGANASSAPTSAAAQSRPPVSGKAAEPAKSIA